MTPQPAISKSLKKKRKKKNYYIHATKWSFRLYLITFDYVLRSISALVSLVSSLLGVALMYSEI